MEEDPRLHWERSWDEGAYAGVSPWSLTHGKGHISINLLQLSLVIQEVLGVEVVRCGEELGVIEQGAQHREHFSALGRGRKGTLSEGSGMRALRAQKHKQGNQSAGVKGSGGEGVGILWQELWGT